MNPLMKQSMTQPRGTFLLIFTQVWESFSFYGMRALLALYLISELHYDDRSAFLLYALYIALVEVGAGFGGYLADRFLGYRNAILWGGGFIAAGHICMIFSSSITLFFLGLGLIITGATLFRSNLKALLGNLYGKEDPRRESGFTLLYTGINVGGFVAALLCGFAAEIYGWHVGFGIAAIGMIGGMALFTYKSRIYKEVDLVRNSPIVLPLAGGILASVGFAYILSFYQIATTLLLPISILAFGALLAILAKKMALKLVLAVCGLLLLLIAYFSVEELMGSLLMVFSENHVNRSLLSLQIPSAVLVGINPFMIMTFGPLLAKMQMRIMTRLSLAFLFLGSAFLVLYMASLITLPSLLYIVVGFGFIAIGELFLAPAVFAFCSKVAPKGSAGLMMGLVTLSFSLASLISGQTSQLTTAPSTLFLMIGMLSTVLACILIATRGFQFRGEFQRT